MSSVADFIGGGSEERTEESVAKVVAGGMGQGEVVYYLEPGDSFEVRDDGPNYVEVMALPDGDTE